MYSKKNREWLLHWDFEVIDLLSFELVYFLITKFYIAVIQSEYPDSEFFYLFLFISYMMVLLFTRPYAHVVQRGYLLELKAVVLEVVLTYAILIIGYFFSHNTDQLSRICMSMSIIFSMLVMWGMHCLLKYRIRSRLSNGKNRVELVIFSDEDHILETLKHVDCSYHSVYHAKAVILVSSGDKNPEKNLEKNPGKNSGMNPDKNSEKNPGKNSEKNPGEMSVVKRTNILENTAYADTPVIYGIDNGFEYLRQEVADEIYIDSITTPEKRDELVEYFLAMGLVVHVAFGNKDSIYPHASMNHIGSSYVITTRINDAYQWQLVLKRVFDICVAIVGLILTGIISIFVVPAIKIADPGPAIFMQYRVGKNGRKFRFYKFRSMYMDAEERKKELMAQNEMSGLMFKMENDPRIIGSEKGPGKGIGNFIRKYSIDELPQFWNILIGDMSLIGTRPPTVGEYEKYEPRHKIRLSMQPGLTGMWQVSGRSDITDFEEVVRLDTEYIVNWSLRLDIKIFFKTIGVVLGKKGSH